MRRKKTASNLFAVADEGLTILVLENNAKEWLEVVEDPAYEHKRGDTKYTDTTSFPKQTRQGTNSKRKVARKAKIKRGWNTSGLRYKRAFQSFLRDCLSALFVDVSGPFSVFVEPRISDQPVSKCHSRSKTACTSLFLELSFQRGCINRQRVCLPRKVPWEFVQGQANYKDPFHHSVISVKPRHQNAEIGKMRMFSG